MFSCWQILKLPFLLQEMDFPCGLIPCCPLCCLFCVLCRIADEYKDLMSNPETWHSLVQDSVRTVPLGVSLLFLFGKLLGFPVGAKLASDLTYSGKICRQEGEYLLTFCSNPSLVFLLTFLGQTCLKGRYPARDLLIPLFLADLCCMLFFRFFVYKGCTATDHMWPDPNADTEKKTSQACSTGSFWMSVL